MKVRCYMPSHHLDFYTLNPLNVGLLRVLRPNRSSCILPDPSNNYLSPSSPVHLQQLPLSALVSLFTFLYSPLLYLSHLCIYCFSFIHHSQLSPLHSPVRCTVGHKRPAPWPISTWNPLCLPQLLFIFIHQFNPSSHTSSQIFKLLAFPIWAHHRVL